MSTNAASEARAAFASRVKQTREERGWSQEELARRLEELGLRLDPTAITRLERGSRAVRVEEALLLSMVLGVPLVMLLTPEKPHLQARLDETRLQQQLAETRARLAEGEALRGRHEADIQRNQARYLEALIRFSASKSLEDLLTGLAAALYWSEDATDDEQHVRGSKLVSPSLLEDLAAAGVPREVIEDAGRYADQQLGHVEREADETALDVYFRLFMGRLLQAYRESRHESGGR